MPCNLKSERTCGKAPVNFLSWSQKESISSNQARVTSDIVLVETGKRKFILGIGVEHRGLKNP